MYTKLISVTLSIILALCVGCAENPVTGEMQLNIYGPDVQSDVSLGRQWAPQVEKEFGQVVQDPQLTNYVNHVGQSVTRVSHAPNIQWHIKVLEHKSVNAFALPGGYLFITTGMLKKLNSEAQLAGILAHEATHVTARHSTTRMSEQIGLDILLSAVVPEDASAGVVQTTSITRQIVSLKYSRDDEHQADVVGMGYMVNAGYNPYGMVETMQMLERENQIRPIEFLSSHPSPHNRTQYLMREIQSRYYNRPQLKIGESDYYDNVLQRLRN